MSLSRDVVFFFYKGNVMSNDFNNEVHEFLNELRDSGEVNMFGATKDLMDEFDMDKREARGHLMTWMNNFKKDDDDE
tara:strand:+ start:2390 stop:2620 length:231 start_codon:yes stop_codon:yes gene_type:complete